MTTKKEMNGRARQQGHNAGQKDGAAGKYNNRWRDIITFPSEQSRERERAYDKGYHQGRKSR